MRNLPAAAYGTSGERLAKALGWFSIALGAAEIAAPKSVEKLTGVKDRHRMLLRIMGAREVAAGVGILARRRPAGWMWARVGGDMVDLAMLGAALSSDRTRRGPAAISTAAVAGVTALDVYCAQRLSQFAARDIRLSHSIAVNRSPEECYEFWRNFGNMPRFMKHIASVRTAGDGRTHWTAKAPGGMRFEWDSEVTREVANHVIAWRSIEGADIDNSGSVHFEPGPAGRGTIVRLSMYYTPPGGGPGSVLANLLGKIPGEAIANDMRRFKQIIETGEVATTEGQPAGRAAGATWLDRLARI
jgi:uncharacterized membrane protein